MYSSYYWYLVQILATMQAYTNQTSPLPPSLPPLLLQEIIIVGLFNTDRAFLLSLLLSQRHIFVEIHIVGKTTRILGSQIEQLFSHTKSQDQTIFHSQILKLKVQ